MDTQEAFLNLLSDPVHAEDVVKFLLAQSGPGRVLTPVDLAHGLTGANLTVHDAIEILKAAVDKQKSEMKEVLKVHVFGHESDYTTGNEVVELVRSNLPTGVFNTEEKRTQYVTKLRKLMETRHPKEYLLMLNESQKKVPFLLLDIFKIKKVPIEYGFADLMRFLCMPYADGTYDRFHKTYLMDKPGLNEFRVWNESEKKYELTDAGKVRMVRENPLYNPIEYPIPNVEANKKMMEMMQQVRTLYTTKLIECERILAAFGSRGKKELKKNYNLQLAFLTKVMNNLKEIYDKVGNPVWISMHSKSQQRPMAEYKREHFYSLLRQLTTNKEMDPYAMGIMPDARTGVSLDLMRVPKSGVSGHVGTSSRGKRRSARGKRRSRKK